MGRINQLTTDSNSHQAILRGHHNYLSTELDSIRSNRALTKSYSEADVQRKENSRQWLMNWRETVGMSSFAMPDMACTGGLSPTFRRLPEEPPLRSRRTPATTFSNWE